MAREMFDSLTARIPARITSALNRQRELSEQRRLSHEQGHALPPEVEEGLVNGTMQDGVEVILPVDPYIVECLDTRVFNQSVSTEEDSRMRPD